jgi:hypothetical protein
MLRKKAGKGKSFSIIFLEFTVGKQRGSFVCGVGGESYTTLPRCGLEKFIFALSKFGRFCFSGSRFRCVWDVAVNLCEFM